MVFCQALWSLGVRWTNTGLFDLSGGYNAQPALTSSTRQPDQFLASRMSLAIRLSIVAFLLMMSTVYFNTDDINGLNWEVLRSM